jgi:hypothetical protein
MVPLMTFLDFVGTGTQHRHNMVPLALWAARGLIGVLHEDHDAVNSPVSVHTCAYVVHFAAIIAPSSTLESRQPY